MFTGLIETQGTIKTLKNSPLGRTIGICNFSLNGDELKTGDSISINGACHTITLIKNNYFEVESMNETLRKTNLGNLKAGDKVNLERAMRADGRFGGHIVSGHIDGTSKLIKKEKDGFSYVLGFEYETKYIVQKGSICINGISLTVSNVGNNYFEVSIIPHTMANTNLNELNIGDFVNVEVDILAKYIEKFTKSDDNKSKIDENFLRENGFLNV